MKRRMEDPQGQSTPSNKRPRIQTEEDFQQAFARMLEIPDFPAEPPRFAAGPENFVRVPTFAAEKEIERLLGLDAQAKPLFASSTDVRHRSKIPEEFSAELRKKYQRGELDGKVLKYYSDILPRGDSKSVPGQGGRALLLKSIMRQEDALPASLIAGPAWRPVRALGKGGFGEVYIKALGCAPSAMMDGKYMLTEELAAVMLWEKTRKNRPPIRIATKESRPHDFFKDYCSEAHLTRRLNDLGCKNVINVVEWAYIGEKYWRNETGTISKSEPRHRICYEYAEYGDFWDLIAWYRMHRLILPEAFLWHVFHSMANALCYCCYGTNEPSYHKRGWDSIVHMDIKPENMLLAAPDLDTHQLYPCVKLADFGLAYTIGVSVTEIRYFKSAGPSAGTEGYVPPEVRNRTPEIERRRRHPHELIGPHCDVYSLAKSIKNGTDLLNQHHQILPFAKATKVSGFETDSRPKLDLVYTSDLWNLINRCQSEDARYRPKLHHLFKETKLGMELFRARAQMEEAEASSNGIPGCFHSNVLFRRVDRMRFETDPVWSSNYRKANLRPVWEVLGPLPPRYVERSEASARPGGDNGNLADPARVRLRGGRGQWRGGAWKDAEGKGEKAVKERKRRGARMQRGIRGLLSKMNFFS